MCLDSSPCKLMCIIQDKVTKELYFCFIGHFRTSKLNMLFKDRDQMTKEDKFEHIE